MSDKDATPAQPKSLVGKLADVMAAVERIPKNGRNTFHNYSYATEGDIVTAIRQELASRNVMLIPGIEAEAREAIGEKGSVLTTLRMTFTFFDGDSGQEITRVWLGCGSDKDDKGIYKAMTGGEKYFLLKTFLIPTGDDPEADAKDKDASQQRDRRPPPRQATTATLAAAPSAAAAAPQAASGATTTLPSLMKRARDLGWTDAELSSRAKSEFKHGLSVLTADELGRFAILIETGEDTPVGATDAQ